MNLENAWDISLGEGVIINYPHEVDYANQATLTGDSYFTQSSFKTEFELISGGNHQRFTLKAGGSKRSTMPPCFWYKQDGGSTPNKYAVPTGQAYNTMGCFYSRNLSAFNQAAEDCRSAHFHSTTGYCRSGLWREDWDLFDTPTEFEADEVTNTGYGYVENSIPITGSYYVNGYNNPILTDYEARTITFFKTSGLAVVSSLGITSLLYPTGTVRFTVSAIINNNATYEVYLGDSQLPLDSSDFNTTFNTKIGEQFINRTKEFSFDFDPTSTIEGLQDTAVKIRAENFDEFNGTILITDVAMDLFLAAAGQGVPPGFAPYSRYTSITPVINGTITPEGFTSTGYGSPVGVAPRATLYLGDASGTNTAVGGSSIRLNPTMTRLSKSDDILLIEPVGDNHNLMETGSEPGVLSIGHCRWIGNEKEINNFSNQTTSGNYGVYAGRGRSSTIMFSLPSDRVWSSRHGMQVSTGVAGGNRTKFNYTESFTYEENDSFLSAGMAAGAIALMLSKNPTWSYEDCITALYQSCNKYQFRTMPKDSGASTYLGSNVSLSTYINDSTETIYINSNPGGQDSTSWYHAFPPDGEKDIYGNDYCIIQFGTGPDDSEYELIRYSTKHILTADTGKKDASTYPNGVLSGCERGYGGTTPKEHQAPFFPVDKIYTPLMTHTGWNEYMGWGIPDLAKALKVKTAELKIMPPWTATGTLDSNNDVVITAMPFRSSNYHKLIIQRSFDYYPLSPSEGKTVFVNSDSTEYITGTDSNLPSGRAYYSVFQLTSGSTRYSEPAKYASFYVDITGWDKEYVISTTGFTVEWARHNSDNISGYVFEIYTGGVLVSSFDNGDNTSVSYIETGGHTTIDVAILAYTTGGSILASSQESFNIATVQTPTGYVLGYRDKSAIYKVDSTESYSKAKFNLDTRFNDATSITIDTTGNAVPGEFFDYYGATVQIITDDGRISTTGPVNYIYYPGDYSTEYIVSSFKSAPVATLPTYTTNGQPVYTSGTRDSGMYISVATGEYFDILTLHRSSEFFGKPVVLKSGTETMASGYMKFYTVSKERYPEGNYKAIIPRFLV